VTDLVQLAQRLVEIDREAQTIRSSMLKLLTNGAGGDLEAVHPLRPGAGPAKRSRRTRSSAKPSGRHAQMMAAGAAAEERIIAALKAQPGMRSKEIAEATEAKTSTVSERLRRLKAKGLVAAAENGGWATI
jgi:hypothetical protein